MTALIAATSFYLPGPISKECPASPQALYSGATEPRVSSLPRRKDMFAFCTYRKGRSSRLGTLL